MGVNGHSYSRQDESVFEVEVSYEPEPGTTFCLWAGRNLGLNLLLTSLSAPDNSFTSRYQFVVNE